MREHDYCCCAIPLLNTGIYLSLIEQLAAGILIGTLTLAAPPIVGVSIPSFSPYIFAGLCYLVSLTQILGFLGVSQEKAGWFRTYTLINTIATLLAFALAGALIGISASKHNTVVSTCETQFFATMSANVTAGVTDGEGAEICNIFAWVDVGVLGGLWLLLAIFQGYLLIITRLYSRDQRADHKKYYSIYSTQDDILLNDRSAPSPAADPWDARASTDSWQPPPRDDAFDPSAVGKNGGYEYSHARQASDASTIRGGDRDQPYAARDFAAPPQQNPYDDPPNPYSREPSAYGESQPLEAEQQRGMYGGPVPPDMGVYDRGRLE